MARFARRLADTLSAPATRNVIVDVRLNNGGNNGLLAALIATLVQFERARDADPNDTRPWIDPQLPAPLSAEAYFANQDPVLAVVLQAIAGNRSRR